MPVQNVRSISVGDRERVLAERDRLIEENLNLVRQLAHLLLTRLPDGYEIEDLIGAGNVGLLRAATVYRARPGIPFAAYARKVIHGFMVDSVRRREYKSRVLRTPMPTFDCILAPEVDADASIDADRRSDRVAAAIAGLPARLRFVVEMHYVQGALMREVAEQLGVSPGRASQIRAEAVELLKLRLRAA